MLDGATERRLQDIAASHAEQVMIAARDGYKQDGRGAVIIRVDPDSEECNIIWRPLSGMKTRKLRRMAMNYDPSIEDLLVILPTGRLEGRGWFSRTVLRELPR